MYLGTDLYGSAVFLSQSILSNEYGLSYFGAAHPKETKKRSPPYAIFVSTHIPWAPLSLKNQNLYPITVFSAFSIYRRKINLFGKQKSRIGCEPT